ncbi:MAG: hypothetical protein ACRBCK_12425 [Alphaproteobacteria bacterium]
MEHNIPDIDLVELTLYFSETLIEFDTLSDQEKQDKIQIFRIIAALCRNLSPGQHI